MPRFKLIVLPDGRLVLTSESSMSDQEAAKVVDLWDDSKKDPRGVVVLPDCEVVVVKP